MRYGFDISDPGDLVIAGYDVAGGYIGGATPHVWTAQQWHDQPARFRSMFWLPFRDQPGKRQGQDIGAALEALGAPHDCIVWLDMETSSNPVLVDDIANEVHAIGYKTGVYGSASTVFSNPPRSGYMVAHYDDVARIYEHPHALAKQYENEFRTPEGAVVDRDVYADGCPLWDTRPSPVTLRPPWATAVLGDLATVIADAAAARTAIENNVK